MNDLAASDDNLFSRIMLEMYVNPKVEHQATDQNQLAYGKHKFLPDMARAANTLWMDLDNPVIF